MRENINYRNVVELLIKKHPEVFHNSSSSKSTISSKIFSETLKLQAQTKNFNAVVLPLQYNREEVLVNTAAVVTQLAQVHGLLRLCGKSSEISVRDDALVHCGISTIKALNGI